MITNYRTINKPGEGIYREKGSKFIGIAFHVHDREAFKERLERSRKEHHGARHHCYSFILGDDGTYVKTHDDGEPSGTAGMPIQRKLQQASLTYAGCMVVRYFGGTKLGKAGLVRAYGEAAHLAVQQATIITKEVMIGMMLTCPIAAVEVARGFVLGAGGSITDERYTDHATLCLQVPIAKEHRLLSHFKRSEVDLSRIDQ